MDTNREWTVRMPAESGWDVAVVGGGAAGCAAAVAAARRGLKTVLIEQLGALGGLGTSGLVCAFDPMADGERPLVGGFCREVVDRLYAAGELGPDERPEVFWKAYHHWTPFRPEGLKRLLDDLMAEAGVTVRFFTRLVGVDADAGDGRVRGLVTHDVEGFRAIAARAYVDASGDAALAHGAGARTFRAGRDTPRIMPPTMPQLMADVDWSRWEGWHRQQEALERALADGFFADPTRHLPGLSRIGRSLGYLNGGHLFGMDPLDAASLSEGMARGRRIAARFLAFYRRYVPGCEHAEMAATGALPGVRETRRVDAERNLALDDYLARRQFPDQIGVFNKFVDIHPYDDSPEELARFRRDQANLRLGPGECFGLPYGMLVPKGWRNLWVAGRCAGTDVPMQGTVRVMPPCFLMGEAAGRAAALALRDGVDANAIPRDELAAGLRDGGAAPPRA